MNAKLRWLHSPDVPDLDLDASGPPDAENFCILVQAGIGPRDEAGADTFDFLVCTPRWLLETTGDGAWRFGRHLVIVQQYDAKVIRAAIESLCENALSGSWEEVAAYLGGYGAWEFEDYTEHRGP